MLISDWYPLLLICGHRHIKCNLEFFCKNTVPLVQAFLTSAAEKTKTQAENSRKKLNLRGNLWREKAIFFGHAICDKLINQCFLSV